MGAAPVADGSELDVLSSVRVIETVSAGDPSTGWVLMAAALAIGTGAAYLGREAVDALFAGERLPVIAGQGTRPGVAVPTAGGFRLSGSWSFASGIKHATHIHTLGLIEGTNEPRIFVLPVAQATLVDNWDVLGLRATGSIDYRIQDVFVPEAYTHFAVTETPKQGGDLYRLGIVGFAAICHSSWACGIGRRLLDELAAKVRGGAGRSGTQASSETFHEEYAKSEAKYRAARALVYRRMGKRQRDLAARRHVDEAAAHHDPSRYGEHHVGMQGRRGFRLQERRHGRASRRHDSASVPRHAGRHAAHHLGAAGDSQRRTRTRGSRRGQALALPGSRRLTLSFCLGSAPLRFATMCNPRGSKNGSRRRSAIVVGSIAPGQSHMSFRMLRQSIAVLGIVLCASACRRRNAAEHVKKAQTYSEAQQYAEAALEYRTALQQDGQNGDVHLKLADTYMQLTDARNALREYVRAADLLPKSVEAQLKAGELLLAARQFEDAKTRADKAIELDPKSVDAQVLRGNALAGLKDLDAAMGEYQDAIALDPKSPTAYDNLAVLQLARGKREEAEATFKSAIQAVPSSVPARLALANFYWSLGRRDKAETVLKATVALDKDNLTANRALGLFYVATIASPTQSRISLRSHASRPTKRR